MPDLEQPPPMATPRVAAGALFFDKDGNILLVKPTYKEGWDIPGGYVEPGETPSEACQREIEEELGLKVPIRQLLAVDWAPSHVEGAKMLFVFDGGTVLPTFRDNIVLSRDELETLRFQPIESIDDLMPRRLSLRLHAAISARAEGMLVYLEYGATDWRGLA